MTIGDVIAADRSVDLLFRYQFGDEVEHKGKRAPKPAPPPTPVELLDRQDRAAVDPVAWVVWRLILGSVRTLLREPAPWPGWEPLPIARAAHTLAGFQWSPPIARQLAPRPASVPRLAKRLDPRHARTKPILELVGFWAGVEAGGADGAFLAPAEVRIVYTSELEGFVCRECKGVDAPLADGSGVESGAVRAVPEAEGKRLLEGARPGQGPGVGEGRHASIPPPTTW